MAMVTYSSEELKNYKGKTDWERVKNMTDDEIDFSDIPMLTDEMAAKGVWYHNGDLLKQLEKQSEKKSVEVPLDFDIVAFFKSMGDDWQERINEALTQVVKLKKVLT